MRMATMMAVLLLAGCGGEPAPVAGQIVIRWPQGQRLYVADGRNGLVRGFVTADSPRAAAEGRAPGRSSVLAMHLDAQRRRLWVVGPEAIYAHDAASLVLLRRYPLSERWQAGDALRVDAEGALLVSSPSGTRQRFSFG